MKTKFYTGIMTAVIGKTLLCISFLSPTPNTSLLTLLVIKCVAQTKQISATPTGCPTIQFNSFFFFELLYLYFFNFLFYIEVYLINNVVKVSCEQQRDSTIYKHVSFLPQTSLPSRLPHNTEQSFLCYTVGPCWLSI